MNGKDPDDFDLEDWGSSQLSQLITYLPLQQDTASVLIQKRKLCPSYPTS